MGLRIHFVVDPHVFYGIAIFCLVALVRASFTDPGRLPENPKIPHGEREFWELCNKCNLMRPKRSHHCSRCGHCVRRMDHHCPWINNCVGEDNHWLFLQLCFYTELLTSYALMFSFCHYYYFLPVKKRNLDLFVVRHELAIMRLAAFMGITMLVGITGLFYTQLIGIITFLMMNGWKWTFGMLLLRVQVTYKGHWVYSWGQQVPSYPAAPEASEKEVWQQSLQKSFKNLHYKILVFTFELAIKLFFEFVAF
ncbi:palmitoyltransferase ZDHHC21 isoform X3 [Canis lupus baileyi]|uniref:palmitoyltransferase ZDHHC21 isoform X3 n=1 Tax=Canis lupus dingo TaxID=286419 RepID=UPI000DC6C37B|nr:palmitoyltransferase ZDHHC21 isoform X3 [Canis lupus dingo]XP_038408346.1 palmitoyltransferase ZDHHC21 isoform X3 [Canis lupus familiaris]XP_038537700.1 palmitoyltransferase ZDHHC21 isoform X3 [Canis lupus familiaris]XP_048972088.1 palmitoyltransferase ZDHHC21 isoform X3 [Canis lupus dingo]